MLTPNLQYPPPAGVNPYLLEPQNKRRTSTLICALLVLDLSPLLVSSLSVSDQSQFVSNQRHTFVFHIQHTMEGGAAAPSNVGGTSESASYTYWVRKDLKDSKDAAPLPVPRKLSPQDLLNSSNSHSSNHLGSAWNRVCFIFL